MLKQLKIKFNGIEYQCKRNYAAVLMFEEIAGKSAFQINTTLKDSLIMHYAMIKANNLTFDYDFHGFIVQYDIEKENDNDLFSVISQYLVELAQDESRAIPDNKKKVTKTKKV
jgi:hypothetical protein